MKQPETNLWYVTKRTYEHKPWHHSENNEPSQTIPDQTMSIEEIVRRYSQGEQLKETNTVFLDSDDLDNINRFYAPGALDLTDIELLQDHIQHLQSIIANREEIMEQSKPDDTTE